MGSDGKPGTSAGNTIYPLAAQIGFSSSQLQAPTETLTANNVTTANAGSESPYSFYVVFQDPNLVDVGSFAGSAVEVQPPNGSPITARLVSTTPSDVTDSLGNGSTLTATYQFTPPSGNWGASPHGTYGVTLDGSPVTDLDNNSAPTGTLGSFNVSVDQLVVTTQPAISISAGNSFDVQVLAEDDAGNVDPSFSGSVTIALANNPGNAFLGGTLTVEPVNGVADFQNLQVDHIGRGYTLQASSDGLAPVRTSSFNVTANQLVVTMQPPVTVLVNNGFGFAVSAEDGFGNVDTSFNGSVTVALINSGGNPSSLGGALTVTAVNGVANFFGLTIGQFGSYALSVTSHELAGTATNPFKVTTLASISGTVFQDYNANGVQDPVDPGLAGQTLFLDLNDSGTFETGDPTATTDANGNFQFTVLSPATYVIRQVLFGGVLLSAPAGDNYQVTVTGAVNVTGLNFGDVLTSITVPLTLSPATAFPAQETVNADYIEAVYRAVLDRNADSGGLTTWTNLLSSGALSRLQVVQGIRNSPEHFTQEIDDFYFTLLGRPADAGGLNSWVAQLQNGVREEQIAFDFLDSAEYLSKGDKFFVDSMYRSLLGRPFDSAGEASWLSQLGDDTSGKPTHPAVLTHEQVILDFLYSKESLTRLIAGYYQVFLQRLADSGGLNSWLGQLKQGLPFLTIGQEFLASDEFYNRAAAAGHSKSTVLAAVLSSNGPFSQMPSDTTPINTSDPNVAAAKFVSEAQPAAPSSVVITSGGDTPGDDNSGDDDSDDVTLGADNSVTDSSYLDNSWYESSTTDSTDYPQTTDCSGAEALADLPGAPTTPRSG
jgi:hypothetical protein